MSQIHKLIFIFLTVNLFLTCDSIFFPVQPADSQSEEFADVHKYANDEVTRDEVAQGIKLSLYQRLPNKHNEEWKRMLNDGSGRVPLGIWNFDGDVKVLIHGITVLPVIGLEGQYYMEMGREYSKLNSTVNVILLDWSCCSDGPDYPAIVKNTRRVGFKLAQFLVALKNVNAFKTWDQVHIVGFSLGAHTAGVAGHFVQDFSKGRDKIGRITGLDPAGPLFDLANGLMPKKLDGFLDKSDAKFVDIIHCNMGLTTLWITAPIEGYLGSVVQAGHADFYPNGGREQKIYCTHSNDHWGCSHLACNKYYIHSIRNPQVACSCETYEKFKAGGCPCSGGQKVYMGHHCVPKASGKYYLSISLDIGVIDVTKGFFRP